MRNLFVRVIAVSFLLATGQRFLAGQEPAPTPSNTQQAPQPHGRVERQLQRMRETLNLTDDQVAQIRPVLETRNQQLKELRANSSMPQGEARAKAVEVRKSARRQIEHILTPEQRQKQKALRRGRQAGGQVGR
jgi:Spy/CpxP family protein refolding chaperone